MRIPAFLLALLLVRVTFAQALDAAALAADSSLWPREVIVHTAHQAPLILNGRTVGSTRIPPGRTYPVLEVGPQIVVVKMLGGTLSFPHGDTDLALRVAKLQAQRAAAPKPSPDHSATPSPAPQAPAPPPTPPAAATPASNASGKLARELEGDLATLDGRRLRRLPAAAYTDLASKKFIAVYFSASWCGPCRQFTPKLVEWYEQHLSRRGDFEVIFVSRDRSEQELTDYMREYKMPFPAVDYSRLRRNALASFAGPGIPCLVLLDPDGTVLSHSYVDGQYLGPSKVLRDLEKLLGDAS